jgi:hypothetical protein
MKKTIITTIALVCATFCASAQNTNSEQPKEVKAYRQYSIGQNSLFNVQNGAINYTLNVFGRLDKDSIPTKGAYYKIGVALPENRFIFYGAIGMSFPASKTNVNRFVDVGIVFQNDFTEKKKPEMYGMFGLESAYRWDNLTKSKILNIRLGLVAGYHNYKTFPVGAVVENDSKAGFRIMPTLGVSINLFSKSVMVPTIVVPVKKR